MWHYWLWKQEGSSTCGDGCGSWERRCIISPLPKRSTGLHPQTSRWDLTGTARAGGVGWKTVLCQALDYWAREEYEIKENGDAAWEACSLAGSRNGCVNKDTRRPSQMCHRRRIKIPCDCPGDLTLAAQGVFPEHLSSDLSDSCQPWDSLTAW